MKFRIYFLFNTTALKKNESHVLSSSSKRKMIYAMNMEVDVVKVSTRANQTMPLKLFIPSFCNHKKKYSLVYHDYKMVNA